MGNYWILIGYLPVVVASSLLAIHYYKKKGDGPQSGETAPQQLTEYAGKDSPGQEEGRLLADDIAEDEYDDLKERLISLFESEKIYLDPDIRISDVAAKLLTSKPHLSKAIRIKTGRNFCQLVHHYRVKEAMRLYMGDESLTISQLCRQVGFNSMTTFNTAFGRNTGFTPAEWCKNYRKKIIRESLRKN